MKLSKNNLTRLILEIAGDGKLDNEDANTLDAIAQDIRAEEGELESQTHTASDRELEALAGDDPWSFAATAAEEAQKLNQQLGWGDGGYSTDQSYWLEREIETGEEFAQYILFSSYWQTYYDEYGIRPRWMLHLKDAQPKEIQAELDNLQTTIAREQEEDTAAREEEEFWAEHDKEFTDQAYADIAAADAADAAKHAETELMMTPEPGQQFVRSRGMGRRPSGRHGRGQLSESIMKRWTKLSGL